MKSRVDPFGLQSLSAQARLFKFLKLWSYYVDLEESIGSVETTKAVYDKILELRIAMLRLVFVTQTTRF